LITFETCRTGEVLHPGRGLRLWSRLSLPS